jgi:predicted anti-sigma-YlaC factor YlaD
MRSDGCTAIRDRLGLFVDGELTGAERLEVRHHLDRCEDCTGELGALDALGDTLRTIAEVAASHTPDLAGLAAGVVSRSRAEADLSWRAWFGRASGDWQWLIVGAGSIAATVTSALLVSAILAFGPEPERRDSLAGIITDLQSAGVVLAYAAPLTLEQDIVLLSSDDGEPRRVHAAIDRNSPAYWPAVEAHLVEELVWTVNRSRSGARWDDGDPTDRLIQEALLEEITRLRLAEPMMVGRPTSTNVAVSSAIRWRSTGGLLP